MMPDVQHHSLFIEIFSKHPILGATFALLMAFAGQIMPLLDMQVPIIVMQSIQITVWFIGGIAGILTIRGVLKKK